MASNNWGGKREGSGRPMQGQSPVKRVQVTLPEHLLETLDKVVYSEKGGGSRSGFIAKVLAAKLKVKL
jgi:metal-responsive CopG/Arc/MetJ family transcriptional regulator